MKSLIMLLLSVMIFSCSDKEDQFMYDVNVEMGINGINGVDLLNLENPNSFTAENIKLFYLINEEEVEIYDENMDMPRNFMIYKHQDEFRIRIAPNNAKSEVFPITYIKWNETDTDTLKCDFKRTPYSVICTKVWFNGELRWDTESQTERFFTIIK